MVGSGQALGHVTELQRSCPVHVPPRALAVQKGPVLGQRLLQGHDLVERLVAHVDQIEGLLRDRGVARGHRCHWLADVPNSLDGQGVLVLADGEDAVRDREVSAGDDRLHAGQGLSPAGVDAGDGGMGVGAEQVAADQHARWSHVIREHSLARDLVGGVDAGQSAADDGEVISHRGHPSTRPAGPRR